MSKAISQVVLKVQAITILEQLSITLLQVGYITYQIADLYEAKIVLYDKNYAYIRDEAYSSVRTFTLAESSYFKVVVKSKTSNLIVPSEIETSNLKVANEGEATAWNMYFGDLTLEQQKDQYVFSIFSQTGLTFDGDTTLKIRRNISLERS